MHENVKKKKCISTISSQWHFNETGNVCVTGLLRISISYVEAVSFNDVFSVILLWKHTVLCYSNLISASRSIKMSQEKKA